MELSSHNKKRRKQFLTLKTEQCDQCNITPIWNNRVLVLHIDHKDGDPTNNNIDNLRWLCPNCHSQTHNYCAKNRKQSNRSKDFRDFLNNLGSKDRIYDWLNTITYVEIIAKFRVAPQAIKIILQEFGIQSKPTVRKKQTKRPTKEDLINLIAEYPMTAIGKKYGVSDNAVRKWAASYGISRDMFWSNQSKNFGKTKMVDNRD